MVHPPPSSPPSLPMKTPSFFPFSIAFPPLFLSILSSSFNAGHTRSPTPHPPSTSLPPLIGGHPSLSHRRPRWRPAKRESIALKLDTPFRPCVYIMSILFVSRATLFFFVSPSPTAPLPSLPLIPPHTLLPAHRGPRSSKDVTRMP